MSEFLQGFVPFGFSSLKMVIPSLAWAWLNLASLCGVDASRQVYFSCNQTSDLQNFGQFLKFPGFFHLSLSSLGSQLLGVAAEPDAMQQQEEQEEEQQEEEGEEQEEQEEKEEQQEACVELVQMHFSCIQIAITLACIQIAPITKVRAEAKMQLKQICVQKGSHICIQTFKHTDSSRLLWSREFTKTSQELRMLSSVTINCQVTMIVMNSGSQLSEL